MVGHTGASQIRTTGANGLKEWAFFESLKILSSHDSRFIKYRKQLRQGLGWLRGLAAGLAPRVPLPPRQRHGPRRKHSILMRLWSILWVTKCRPPARVPHQGSASLLCYCLKNWVTHPDRWDGEGALCSNRPGGLVVLVRRAALLPLPREGSCLLIPVGEGRDVSGGLEACQQVCR